MDDRKASISPHDPNERVGADAAPIAPRVRRPAGLEDKLVVSSRDQVERLPATPLREDRFVVYCGNAQRISEGFAVALRAMGVEGHRGLPATNQNREDN